ncbi:MAG: outer membrane beta-barrel protein [Hyphomicrobium sp.]
MLAVSTSARAGDLDIDDRDGLNTTTIAKQERDKEWLEYKAYGAQTVAGQNRNFAKPDGVRVGNYVVMPEVGALVTYDDNIYASDEDKVGDIRTDLTPSVKFRSELPRHVLDLSLDGKIVNYLENTDQDYANVRARAEGALQFDHAHTLSATVLSSLDHEERTSPSYPFSAQDPQQVWYNMGAVGITRDVGRLYGTISAAAQSWDFANNVTSDGSTLDMAYRDTRAYSTSLRVGYRISPGFDFVTKLRGIKIWNRGDETSNQSSLGYEALAGLAFETNPLLRWRIMGGFGVRDYEQAGIATLNTSLLEAEVEWLPTQRLTIYGTVMRRLNDIGGPDGSSLLQTGVSLRADYEIYHNLVLNLGASVRDDQSLADGTSELVYGGSIGLEYYLNKNWLFTFTYQHDVRESDSESRNMHRNRFMVGAKLRF